MRDAVIKRLPWMALVLLGFGGLVAGAYAIGPVSARCSIVGAGTLTQSGGRIASFTGLAVAPAAGAESYDAAASSGPRLRSLRIARVVCSAGATAATVTGTGAIGGHSPLTYRIDFGLANVTHPTYRIRLGDGYDSGQLRMTGGTLRIAVGTSQRTARSE